MATKWIVTELWDIHGREIEHAFATKSAAENWVRLACSGEKQPENIYIEERPVVAPVKECYHCKATADLVWHAGYGGIHLCGFCKVLEDKSCGGCDKQNDGTFKTGEDGFLVCPDCDDTPMKCCECEEEFDRCGDVDEANEICLPCLYKCEVCEERREERDKDEAGLCEDCEREWRKCDNCEEYEQKRDMKKRKGKRYCADCYGEVLADEADEEKKRSEFLAAQAVVLAASVANLTPEDINL